MLSLDEISQKVQENPMIAIVAVVAIFFAAKYLYKRYKKEGLDLTTGIAGYPGQENTYGFNGIRNEPQGQMIDSQY